MNFISWQKISPMAGSTGNLILVSVYSQFKELVLHSAHFQLKAYLFSPQLFTSRRVSVQPLCVKKIFIL